MDHLEIGPVNACEMAFKNGKAMWKTFKSDCAVPGQERSERKFLKLAERRKKKALSSRRKPQSACAVTSGYPNAPFTRIRRAPGHPDDPPLKSFSNSSG